MTTRTCDADPRLPEAPGNTHQYPHEHEHEHRHHDVNQQQEHIQ